MKRDDSLHLPGSNISGNKARKFLSLNNLPAVEFPDAIVSYGGPQSNAMVALAAIVSSKNAQLREKHDDVGGAATETGDKFWELDVLDDEIQLRRKDEEDYDKEEEEEEEEEEESFSEKILEPAAVPQKRFIYYTKPIPRYLRKNPSGNLLRALALGMEIRCVISKQGYQYSALFYNRFVFIHS
jgi:hypothetical protein